MGLQGSRALTKCTTSPVINRHITHSLFPSSHRARKHCRSLAFKQVIAADLLQPKAVHEGGDLLQDLGRHFCTCSPPTGLPVRSLGKAACCILVTAVILQRQEDEDALPFVSSPKQKVKAKVVKAQPEDTNARATAVAAATSSYDEMLPLY